MIESKFSKIATFHWSSTLISEEYKNEGWLEDGTEWDWWIQYSKLSLIFDFEVNPTKFVHLSSNKSGLEFSKTSTADGKSFWTFSKNKKEDMSD